MNDERTNLCIICNVFSVILNGSIDTMVFSTRDGVGLTSTQCNQDTTTSSVHSGIFARFCSIGVQALKDRTPQGLKESKTGYSFPGELCFRPTDTHCPRITGVGYDCLMH